MKQNDTEEFLSPLDSEIKIKSHILSSEAIKIQLAKFIPNFEERMS